MSTKTPLGIFWDIENCQIPHTKAVSSVVKHIREFVANKHQECGFVKDFTCACDVIRLGAKITESLDRNGVNVVHVNARAKNAAEDKLQELIDVFVDNYGIGSVLCIISSDINLAKQIRNARRKDLDVVLIHSVNCSVDLKNLANQCFLYEEVIKDADNYVKEDHQKIGILEVTNLPRHKRFEDMNVRLSQLTNNCGGKIGFIDNGKTFIRFASRDDAQRCLNRINGEDVFGSKIDVRLLREDTASHQMRNSSHSQQRLEGTAGHHSHENQPVLEVSNLPINQRFDYIKSRLTQLTMNFGGIPQYIQNGKTLIRFCSRDEARRCLKQINGENVFGNRINVRLYGEDSTCNQVKNNTLGHFTEDYSANNSHAISSQQDTTYTVSDGRISVVKGLFTKKDDNLLDVIRYYVSRWNDPNIKTEFVCGVTPSMKKGSTRRDGKLNLFVTAKDEETCAVLIKASKIHIKESDGIKWEPLLKTSYCDTMIEGLSIPRTQSPTDVVKKLVLDWGDSEINPNFIDNVCYDRSGGKSLLVVTATSPQNSKALLSGAKKYLASDTGIKWFFTRRSMQDQESPAPFITTEKPTPLPRRFKAIAEDSQEKDSRSSIVNNFFRNIFK